MTRKQWINQIDDEQAQRIHTTFRQLDKNLFSLPQIKKLQPADAKHGHSMSQQLDAFNQQRRTVVRNFLRKNKLSMRDLNVQYGRLAAGLPLNLKTVA